MLSCLSCPAAVDADWVPSFSPLLGDRMTDSASSLNIPEQERCAFCDYLTGRRPFTVLRRDRLVVVLVTREQRGLGHLLVLPARRYPTLLESRRAECHELIDIVTWAAAATDEAYERPGIAVWQDNGIAAHQAIPHLHFHVAATLPGGGTNFGDVPELGVAETNQIAARILSTAPPIDDFRRGCTGVSTRRSGRAVMGTRTGPGSCKSCIR